MQAGGVAEQAAARGAAAGGARRRGQRLDDRGPAAGVLQAHPADVPFQVARGEQREQGVLHGFRHPLAEVGRSRAMRSTRAGRATSQPAPKRRRQRLRRRAEVDDHLGVHAVQGGQRPDVVTELAVVVVFHDDRAGGLRAQAVSACLRPTGRRPPSGYWCAGVVYSSRRSPGSSSGTTPCASTRQGTTWAPALVAPRARPGSRVPRRPPCLPAGAAPRRAAPARRTRPG